MVKTISALAALRKELDFRYLGFFLLVFLVPLDYVLTQVDATPLFCFILAFIVKEDMETQWIDMRWALVLLLTTLLMTKTPLETFVEALLGWLFFKSFLYMTAHFTKIQPTGESKQTEMEGAKETAKSKPLSPLPFVPFFVAGVFAATTFWMCVSIRYFEQVQKGLTETLYSDAFPVNSLQVGSSIIPSCLVFFLILLGILSLASYGGLRTRVSLGYTPEYIMGDGDPIIFATFLGILPFMVYLLSFAFALVFILGAFILQYKRGTTDVPNR